MRTRWRRKLEAALRGLEEYSTEKHGHLLRNEPAPARAEDRRAWIMDGSPSGGAMPRRARNISSQLPARHRAGGAFRSPITTGRQERLERDDCVGRFGVRAERLETRRMVHVRPARRGDGAAAFEKLSAAAKIVDRELTEEAQASTACVRRAGRSDNVPNL